MRFQRAMRSAACWGAFLIQALAGCERAPEPKAEAPARPYQGVKLVVGAVGDPAILASVKSQRGEWAARTGGDIEIRDTPVDPAKVEGVDVLIFTGDRMGDLVEAKTLAAIPDAAVEAGSEASDAFAYQEIVPAYRDLVTRYGPDRMALPLGGSALVIAYRRGALERPEIREAAEKAGIKLGPPRTWEEFDALARFLHGKDWDGDGAPESGLALAWGSDPEGVGDGIWLARAAASAFHKDQFAFLLDSETTAPRVASPPFVESLRALVGLAASGPAEAKAFDAEAARKAFRTGEAALLIDRAERASSWGETPDAAIGVWPLPGSGRVFDPSRQAWEESADPNRPTYLLNGGGWLAGVVAAGTRRDAALDFARHLSGPEASDRMRAEKGFPMLAVRGPQLAKGMNSPRSAPGVEARPWAEAVRKTMENERIAPGLRIPDAPGYLADLARARASAVGGTPVDQALDALAKAWADRSKARGEALQTWHHRRGLPGVITPPEPPSR
ncbi:ABC transporter substrate-binding protein [Tundrisphaera sp. TA3]|uniref:ABC transporter substrate-binding protein n=1 Tax=Tundrisphaera sp. TA3 TaxID=3435775 RepID=UPI003EC15078